MKSRGVLLSALLALLTTVVIAYAVQITLEEENVNMLGATDNVMVECPVSGCKITRVRWAITGATGTTPYYQVDKVEVVWTPAETGTYTVYVELYGIRKNLEAHGYTSTGNISGGKETTTEVDVDDDDEYVDPRDIYYVRIVIAGERQSA